MAASNPVEVFKRPLIEGPATFKDKIILPKERGEGLQTDPDSPSYTWRDLEGVIRYRDAGLGSPVLSTFRGNIRGPSFAAGDDYDLMYHIPHDYVPGTDLQIHCHWAHNGTSISGQMVVTYYVSYAKGHNQANFSAEVTLVQTISTPDVATVPQYRHRLDELQLSASSPAASQLDTDDIEPDGLIEIHFDVTEIPTIGGGIPSSLP